MIPFFSLEEQHKRIRPQLDAAIARVLDSGDFILGREVGELESYFSDASQGRRAIAVSSGTDALLMCLMALGVGPEDEVITTPFTFVATVGAIVRVGAKPVFADIERATFNIDPEQIAVKITDKTKAIIPVHLFGNMANMSEISRIGKTYVIPVIEDAAQAIGAKHQGNPVGHYGDAACLSFYPTKNLGGMGDGGLIITKWPSFYSTLVSIRSHGTLPGGSKYISERLGGNFRMDTLQAAILCVKNGYLEEWTNLRRRNAEIYNRMFKDVPGLVVQRVFPDNYAVYNQYCILVKDRDKLASRLKEKGIGSMVYYPFLVSKQPFITNLGYTPDYCPVAEYVSSHILALPIYPELTPEQIEIVAKEVISFCAE